jgi:hypothetical protein
MSTTKFEVGQVWKARNGDHYCIELIRSGCLYSGPLAWYPDGCVNANGSENLHPRDLVELVFNKKGTKIEMPDNLPPLPPVPEGYDRWEYRGMGWRSNITFYAVSRLHDCVWLFCKLCVANGLDEFYYIEAVKGKQLHAPGDEVEWVDNGEPIRLAREPEMVEFCGGNGKHTGMYDMVNSPPHYQSESGIEAIDAIKAALTPEEFRGYCKGNAMKYVWRERNKGGNQDLEKAAWYLNRLKEEKP